MNLPLLVYAYFLPSKERKSTQVNILASRHFLVWAPICNCPFLEKQRLYKLKLNLDVIRLILQPLLHGGMACLNIFSGGILTYLCLVCFRKYQIYFHVLKFINHFRI